jgi:hypothetical protein
MFRHSAVPRGPFRLPTERTWSKQHPRIRTPRPLVDRFNLGRMHPNKEWWRERRVAPATFMGFPDVTKAEVRGGSLYVEKMDAATLSVIVDKCVSERISNSEFWDKFSWRTQQIINTVSGTELAYLFRGFSRANMVDTHLLLSLWGRTDWLLPNIERADLAVIIEGYMNDKFRNEKYAEKVLRQVDLLLSVRSDWTVNELGCIVAALQFRSSENTSALIEDIFRKAMSLLSGYGFAELPLKSLVGILETMATLHTNGAIVDQSMFFSITRELKESGKLGVNGRENVGETAVSLLASIFRLGHAELEPMLVHDLLIDWYENMHALSEESLVRSVESAATWTKGAGIPGDWQEIILRRIARESYKLTPCAAQRVLGALSTDAFTGSNPDSLLLEAIKACKLRLETESIERIS